ncbi:MAG: O-antigen ligase family protein [Elusimicrobiales bacterium]
MTILKSFNQNPPLFLQAIGLFIFAAALPFSVSLIQGGILLFLAASLWRRYSLNKFSNLGQETVKNPLFIPWMIYLAAGILAAAFSLFPARSFGALNSDWLTAVSFLALCLFLKPEQRDTALNVYLAAIAAAAIYGISQALYGLSQGLDIRAHATNHPVRFGEIMVIGLALTLSRLLSDESLTQRSKNLLYTSAALIVAAIVLSQTRGAYLGTAMVFLSLLVIRPRGLKAVLPLLGGAALLGFALAMLNPSVRYKTASIFRGANSAVNAETPAPDSSINTRLILWRTGFRIIKDYPVFGVGPANVKKVFPEYHPPPFPEDKLWGSLHNLYIHQTAERGFIGLAALLALFAAMLYTAYRNYRGTQSPHTLWGLIIMPAWFTMNITEITFQHVHTAYTVLLALGISIAHKKDSDAPALTAKES